MKGKGERATKVYWGLRERSRLKQIKTTQKV
jgi:hypothetical protein